MRHEGSFLPESLNGKQGDLRQNTPRRIRNADSSRQ
jgi:hypothetical protein